MLDDVKNSRKMTPSLEAVRERAKLAQRLYTAAVDRVRQCNELVLEQHLQQQGWAAVIANLDEVSNEMGSQWDVLRDAYDEFLKKRDYYEKLVNE
jgi:RB1-inducible coiled-coil protein 1